MSPQDLQRLQRLQHLLLAQKALKTYNYLYYQDRRKSMNEEYETPTYQTPASMDAWLIQPVPGRTRIKQTEADTPAAATEAATTGSDADVAPAPSTPPAPDAEHLKVGQALAEVGVAPTKDLYGQGPEQHGSPWKAPIAQLKPIQDWLRRKGYRPFGKYTHKRRNIQVDLGKDAANVYIYITDDNKP